MNPFANAPMKVEGQEINYENTSYSFPKLGRLDPIRVTVHLDIPHAWLDELETWLGNKDVGQRHGKD